MLVRAIRGAITVPENTKEAILEGTRDLLAEIINNNKIKTSDLISIIFTMTSDLNAVFPAVAAREMGLNDVPLMCSSEIDVPGSLRSCVRVLIHINTDKEGSEIKHIYLKGAAVLRPDLAK
ncbi:chorismate mutase [Ruminiclostridium cellobioparum]|uniref:chorismate mutase n=1 Tax=Ruminiclostridium cellobioparum subsp. termitidis CT1112 TaxID=1195236 RepID=S0FW22_RUMCE|nr:chorismate mutase [Ruminiclostridium cellobioparum]EMS73354.1 monofunctional chorismate mutase, gram positive type, clade 1 [Ruminiclostridium cellobioparum subsp. termitidis CT1112]